MNSLLFTFNSQQLPHTTKTISYDPQHQNQSPSQMQERRQSNFRAFRSKKMKRYEQYIENVNLEDISFDPPNVTRTLEHGSDEEDKSPERRMEGKLASRPRVLSKNRKLPIDFNLKRQEKPQSMQLIREQAENQESPVKKKIREEIESISKRSLSKDTPKIHFPCSDKKLPQVFRLRSISHQNVGNTSIKEARYILPAQNSKEQLQAQLASGQKKRQIYLNLAKLSQAICNSQPRKMRPSSNRKKISSFCLNAEQTPRFKDKQ